MNWSDFARRVIETKVHGDGLLEVLVEAAETDA